MKDGFLKAAALSPALRVADCAYNARQIAAALQACAGRGIKLAVFPELALTGYTCGDLFFQQALQQAALQGLAQILQASEGLDLIALVGLPVAVNGKLYNCAAVVCGGRLLGLVPKTCLPNYGEFYEKRHFAPGDKKVRTVTVCGQQVPFGTQLLFQCRQMPAFVLGVELCEDLWSALPPSTFHALAGATVLANLSASDETVGKAEYRRALVANQSARLLCCYLYASAGHGESTQDMVFAGHDLVAENGVLLAETEPFKGGDAVSELDCARMLAERARNTSFVPNDEGYQVVGFDLAVTETVLTRWVDPAPFVPGDARRRAERCELILRMQADGLAKRIEHTHAKTAVIGISGGLDSCLALLVAARAMRQLGRPAADVLAVTMPCFGTTRRTRSNAEILCQELGVSFREVNITATVRSHFADIGHDGQTPDVTFDRGAQDAGPPPGPLRGRHRPHRRAAPGPAGHSGHPRLSRAAARQGRRDRPAHRGAGGPLRTARLLPLLCAAVWLRPPQDLPAGQGRLCRPSRVHRPGAVQVAAQLLLAVLCPAVQAQLPARRPQGGQRHPVPPRGLADAQRRFGRGLAGRAGDPRGPVRGAHA